MYWSQVYHGLHPFKKCIPAGIVGDVGIGGLAIGTGTGMLGRKFGATFASQDTSVWCLWRGMCMPVAFTNDGATWSCLVTVYYWDSFLTGSTAQYIVEARVVLATGELVTASATTNPDLFWAIRGGGGNFGVITHFRFATVDIPEVRLGCTST